jgi:hypothetical protein
MFPSERLHDFAVEENGHLSFHFDTASTKLKGHRLPVTELRKATEDLLAATGNPAPGVKP